MFVQRAISGYIDLPGRGGLKALGVTAPRHGFVAIFPLGRNGVVSIFEV